MCCLLETMYTMPKYILINCAKSTKNSLSLETYSGSRYPKVPARLVETWESFSVAKALDNPKSAIFASMFSFNKMLDVFKSLWIIGGLQPLCRYSNPTTSVVSNFYANKEGFG